jgi:hypothetical protein
MVEFFANGTHDRHVDGHAVHDYLAENVAAGTYSLTAVATDNGGGASTSPSVLITVVGLPHLRACRRASCSPPPVDYATNVTSCAVQLRRRTDPAFGVSNRRPRVLASPRP